MTMRAVRKVLVANRGEIACRVIRACRKLGLSSVAIFSEADTQALHVQLADEAFAVGKSQPQESYLHVSKILEVAQRSGADAIHPGYGFLSESAAFARAVVGAKLVWIGPSPQVIESMGDKGRARQLAARCEIPILAGTGRIAESAIDEIDAAAERVGFPLLVKASAGGGGIGMRRVDEAASLRPTAVATQSMAVRSFGDGSIYLERFVPVARHIELQIFGFGANGAVHFYERDCSTQRRFQKIIEEGPAPGLPSRVRERMADAALRLCRTQQYEGAGTVEFIVDASTFDFYFLEMNTRIQVEHVVTEMNTDYDLVALQIDYARGAIVRLDQHAISTRGHAIECRIYAENPAKQFLPSPGPLTRFRLPAESATLRIETGYREGDRITHFYDPMLAKVISHGNDRDDAIGTMIASLGCTEIEGVTTNLAFLQSVLRHPRFRSGEISTAFISENKSELFGQSAHNNGGESGALARGAL
jgi:3-methylcrotonyl-CoA carboxylase alpha subunit